MRTLALSLACTFALAACGVGTDEFTENDPAGSDEQAVGASAGGTPVASTSPVARQLCRFHRDPAVCAADPRCHVEQRPAICASTAVPCSTAVQLVCVPNAPSASSGGVPSTSSGGSTTGGICNGLSEQACSATALCTWVIQDPAPGQPPSTTNVYGKCIAR